MLNPERIFNLTTTKFMNLYLMRLFNQMGKIIIVDCIYKPPNSSVTDFNTSIIGILSSISFEKKLSYLMGDFNINILNADSHQPLMISLI